MIQERVTFVYLFILIITRITVVKPYTLGFTVAILMFREPFREFDVNGFL
jgi:hypothetical protein